MRIRRLAELLEEYVQHLPHEDVNPHVKVHIGSGEYADIQQERDVKLYYCDGGLDPLEDGDTHKLEDGKISDAGEHDAFVFVIDVEE